MAYIWEKVGMLMAIFVSSVVMGFLPMALKGLSHISKKRFLSFGNSFAGGVFFAIGFLHLLAESDELMSETVDPDYPIAYIMAVVGFTGVFLLEKVIFAHHHSHHHDEGYVKLKDAEAGKKGSLETDDDAKNAEQGVFAYILTFVLSLHSFISGVALGMDTTLTTLISLFVAIISHKWIEAFALGAAINKAQTPETIPRTVKLVLLYSVMEPLGVFVGIVLATALSSNSLFVTQAFVLSVASGTFIYVAVIDILPTEFSSESIDKGKKFLLVLLGMIAITLVVVFTANEHSHGEGSDHSHDHDDSHSDEPF